MRGSPTLHWWLPLNIVSYRAIYEDSEVQNFEPIKVSAAACESRHPTGANYFTVELTVLKEMSQELADLFGLRLPN